METYYQILGILPSAQAAEVTAAYRREAMRWHPDWNGGSREATDRFKLIAEASQVLSDHAQRKLDDEELEKGASQTSYESVNEEAAERILWNKMIKLAFALRRKGVKQEMIKRELIHRGCSGSLSAALAVAAYAHGQDAQANSASSSKSAGSRIPRLSSLYSLAIGRSVQRLTWVRGTPAGPANTRAAHISSLAFSTAPGKHRKRSYWIAIKP